MRGGPRRGKEEESERGFMTRPEKTERTEMRGGPVTGTTIGHFCVGNPKYAFGRPVQCRTLQVCVRQAELERRSLFKWALAKNH